MASGRLGASVQRCSVRRCSEEQPGHSQADAPGVQTMDNLSPLQFAHHAACSTQHRAAEALLPCRQAPVLEQGCLWAELYPLPSYIAQATNFEPRGL